MTKFTKRLTSAFATGAVLLNALAPMAFAEELLITGNGALSDNTVTTTQTNVTTVNQTNNSDINNTVSVSSNTGGNDTSFNTGGDTSVTTGNATSDVGITNVANSNSATVDTCCEAGADVEISGNGALSTNNAAVNSTNVTTLDQNNRSNIDNVVAVSANTGDNTASFNVGGDVTVDTGDTNTTVTLTNMANANSASIGSGSNSSANNGVSAKILGNGALSDNRINLDLTNYTTLTQDNNSDLNNTVAVSANTGNNDGSFNTGGDVSLLTGDADATIEIDNLVNFNSADLDACGCFGDLLAKISGNGADSYNRIAFTNANYLTALQRNTDDTDNVVALSDTTGDNTAGYNVGIVDAASDPSVDTGESDATVTLHNTANANTFGSDFSDLFDSLDFDWDFDFIGLLGHLWGSWS